MPGETTRPEPTQEAFRRFEEVCRARGLKVTHQRLEIFREVMEGGGHPSADAVFTRLRDRMPTLSLDTVYRTLTTFEELGLVARVQVLDTVGRYDGNLTRHHHLVCTTCQAIEDFVWPSFDELEPPPEAADWGAVTGRQVQVWGVCRKCRDQT
ncbi:MAG: transcriptional repressor [Thermodesulfobacteriota bacterium]